MKSFRNFIVRHSGHDSVWIPASAGMTDTGTCTREGISRYDKDAGLMMLCKAGRFTVFRKNFFPKSLSLNRQFFQVTP
jgi:hypothetical protein